MDTKHSKSGMTVRKNRIFRPKSLINADDYVINTDDYMINVDDYVINVDD